MRVAVSTKILMKHTYRPSSSPFFIYKAMLLNAVRLTVRGLYRISASSGEWCTSAKKPLHGALLLKVYAQSLAPAHATHAQIGFAAS